LSTVGEAMVESKPKTADVQEFERRSATYEDSLRQWFFFDRIQRTVLDLAQSETDPESILDIGCGTGRLLRKAKERWPKARLIGVDPAEGMVKNARQLVPDATFYIAMAELLPLPDASVDLVLSTASFHHWLNPRQGIAEIARVLCPNGRCVIADIVMPYGLSLFIRHFRRNNPDKLLKMFVQAGLNVEAQHRRMTRFLVVTIARRVTP
jgi:ubiquinone/menaquinone biosynthesis C-methylase UbiE